jgi:hypothetical protein
MNFYQKSENLLDNLFIYKAEEPAQSQEQMGGQFSKPRGGKYIHREWSGDHWEYTYADDPHPTHHGIQNAHADTHSLPVSGKVSENTHQQATAGNQAAMKQVYQASRQEQSKPVPGQKEQFTHPETGEPTLAAVTKQGTIDEFRARKDPSGRIRQDAQGNPMWDTAHGRTGRAPNWEKFLDKMRQKARAHAIQGTDGAVQFVVMPIKSGKFNDEKNKWEKEGKFKIKIVEGAPGYDLVTGSSAGSGTAGEAAASKRAEESEGKQKAGKGKGKAWKELHTRLGRDAAVAVANNLKRNSELLQERQGNVDASSQFAQGKSASQILQDGSLPITSLKGQQIKNRMANAFQSPEEQMNFMQNLERENQQPIIEAIQSLENRGIPVNYTPGEISPDETNPVYRALKYASEKYDPGRTKDSVSDYLKKKIAFNAYQESSKQQQAPAGTEEGGPEAFEQRMGAGEVYGVASDIKEAMAQRIDEGEDPEDVDDDVQEVYNAGSKAYHSLLNEKLDKIQQAAPELANVVTALRQEANKMVAPESAGMSMWDRADGYKNKLAQIVQQGHIPRDRQFVRLFMVDPEKEDQEAWNTKFREFRKGFGLSFNNSIAKSFAGLNASIHILFDENTVLKKAQPQIQANYSHREGDENHPRYWFTDDLGNYRRYTNAPDAHEDASKYYGESNIHPSEPMQDSTPQFFSQDGRKLTRAPHSGAEVQWNPNYHKNDPKNLWAGRWVNPITGQHEYTYVDADLRSQPKFQINRQVALLDIRLPLFRQYVTALLKSTHIKDRVIGIALALLDQGRLRIREIAGLRVGHVQVKGDHITLANRSLHADSKIQQEIQALTSNRDPNEPLFAVPAVKANGEVDYSNIRRIGPHLLINVLDSLGIPFQALQMYHASQCYSMAFQNVLAQNDVSYDCAHHFAMLDVAMQLGHDLDSVEDYSTALESIQTAAVDPVVVDSIRSNCSKLGIGKNNNPLTKPVWPSIPFVSAALTGRTEEEEGFSKWLHLVELGQFAGEMS